MRKPGHREGVRRYQRYGQTALDVAPTLAPEFTLGGGIRVTSGPLAGAIYYPCVHDRPDLCDCPKSAEEQKRLDKMFKPK